jgi:hypothetical protein
MHSDEAPKSSERVGVVGSLSATELPDTVTATARVIATFALQHLRAAKHFRNRVGDLEAAHIGRPFGEFFDEVRAYSSACLMSCAAGLEALINELFLAHGSPLRSKFDDFEHQFWGKSGIENQPFLKKYQTALRLLGAKPLDQSSRLYRDVWAVHELRNALVHYKPTWDPDRHRVIELRDELDGRFELSPFPDAGANFISMRCMSAGCTRWAFDASISFIAEFDSRTHIDDKKMGGIYSLRD